MQRRQQDRRDGGLTCSASAEDLILAMACMVLLPASAVNRHRPMPLCDSQQNHPQRQIRRLTPQATKREKTVRYAQPNPDLLATMSRMHRYSQILTGSLSPDLLVCCRLNFFRQKILVFPISISRYPGRPMARKEQPASKLDADFWHKFCRPGAAPPGTAQSIGTLHNSLPELTSAMHKYDD